MPPNRSNPYVVPPKPERPRPEQPVVVEPTEPQPPVETPAAGPTGPDYGFIMEPPKPPRRGPGLPNFFSNGSMAVKIGTMFGALLVLIIIISIARSLFSGGGNTQALTDVAQEQQAMIHVLTNDPGEGSRQVTLSPDNQTFAATAKTSLTSAQQQLVIYMTNNHKKIDVNALEENTNPAIDEQLTAAVDNSTYDSTFKQVMQSQLTKYQKALQAAYQKTDGPIGRKLLSDEFDDAKLLLTQLNSPSS